MPNLKIVRLPDALPFQIVGRDGEIPSTGWAVVWPDEVHHDGAFVGCLVRWKVSREGRKPFLEILYEPLPPED